MNPPTRTVHERQEKGLDPLYAVQQEDHLIVAVVRFFSIWSPRWWRLFLTGNPVRPYPEISFTIVHFVFDGAMPRSKVHAASQIRGPKQTLRSTCGRGGSRT